MRNKYTTSNIVAAVAKTLLDNYWVFTSVPLDNDNSDDVAGKFFYLLFYCLLKATFFAYIGYINDRFSSDDNNDSGLWAFFRDHPARTLFAALGLFQTFFKDYWVFTGVPLAGDPNGGASKVVYLLAQMGLTSYLWSQHGTMADKLMSFDNRRSYHRASNDGTSNDGSSNGEASNDGASNDGTSNDETSNGETFLR